MYKIISAHQPNFLPNLGFFEKMNQVQSFILISNLQFEKQEGWQRRNIIPGPNGNIWLTIPVIGSQNKKLKEVKINHSTNWCRKQKKTFQLIYSKSIESKLIPKIEEIYDSNPQRLVDLNIKFIFFIKDLLNIQTKLIVDEDTSGEKYNLLINICKKYNSKNYLSGNAAKNYMTPKYIEELKKFNINNNFMNSSFKENFPYTILHYIMVLGRQEVIKKLNEKLNQSMIINKIKNEN